MNIFTRDQNNKNILLDPTHSHQIMMEWEKPYMEACIQKLQPFGDVLEIGFGLGYSATEIQKFPINSYTLIECDLETYKRALEWKEKYDHKITIIHSKWENIHKKLPKFDSIFFDDYDVGTIEYCKNGMDISCRNMFFIETIKNNLKDYCRFSFYCALNKDFLEEYERTWGVYKNYKIKKNFEEYKINVPENCNYAKDKNLYLPLLEFTKIINYS